MYTNDKEDEERARREAGLAKLDELEDIDEKEVAKLIGDVQGKLTLHDPPARRQGTAQQPQEPIVQAQAQLPLARAQAPQIPRQVIVRAQGRALEIHPQAAQVNGHQQQAQREGAELPGAPPLPREIMVRHAQPPNGADAQIPDFQALVQEAFARANARPAQPPNHPANAPAQARGVQPRAPQGGAEHQQAAQDIQLNRLLQQYDEPRQNALLRMFGWRRR